MVILCGHVCRFVFVSTFMWVICFYRFVWTTNMLCAGAVWCLCTIFCCAFDGLVSMFVGAHVFLGGTCMIDYFTLFKLQSFFHCHTNSDFSSLHFDVEANNLSSNVWGMFVCIIVWYSSVRILYLWSIFQIGEICFLKIWWIYIVRSIMCKCIVEHFLIFY